MLALRHTNNRTGLARDRIDHVRLRVPSTVGEDIQRGCTPEPDVINPVPTTDVFPNYTRRSRWWQASASTSYSIVYLSILGNGYGWNVLFLAKRLYILPHRFYLLFFCMPLNEIDQRTAYNRPVSIACYLGDMLRG